MISNNGISIKDKISLFQSLIDKPATDSNVTRNSCAEDNGKMLKVLNVIASDRKNAMRRSTKTDPAMEAELSAMSSRRRTLSIANNPTLKLYFDKILNNFNVLVKEIPVHFLNKQNVDEDNDELLEVLKLWRYFTKDDENIMKMTESGVIDKIVVIMESETIFSIHCQEQAFSLFEKITNNDIVNEYLVKDETFCLFLFRQMTKISKAFEDENEIDQFAKAKNVIFTRMLSQLTKENVFMEQNRKKLNKEKIFDMISNDKCETSVAVHFLIMIKSIMKYNIEHPLQIPKEKEEEEVDEDTVNENECDLLLNVIWKKYESEITVIKVIIDIFAVKIDNEKYIMTLMKSQLIESLCKVLILGNLDKQKKNSDGFLSVISLLNQLCKYEPCVAIIAEISIFPILTALKENIFNTKIVEGSLSLFVSVSSDDKYINKVCINEMKETTIQIINKYLNTCHTQIIVLSLKLILSFIKENKNLFFYSLEGMETLLKAFKFNIKNIDITSLLFDIINIITMNDKEIEVERVKRANTIKIAGIQSTIQRSQTIASSQIQKTSTSEDFSFDFLGLLGIITDIFSVYVSNYTIIAKLYELLINLSKISTENWVRKSTFEVVINNANKLMDSLNSTTTENDIKNIELFINTILILINIDKSIIQTDNFSVLFIINKISNKVTMNKEIIDKFINILFIVCEKADLKILSQFYPELNSFLSFFRNNEDIISDRGLMTFSRFINLLCKEEMANVNEIANSNTKFILKFLNKNIESIDMLLQPILEDIKNIINFYSIKDEKDAEEITSLLISVFVNCLKTCNNEALSSLFQIVITLFNVSSLLKLEFKKNPIDLIAELNSYKKTHQLDQRLEYYIKSYEMSMKFNEAKLRNSIYCSSKEKQNNLNQFSDANELKKIKEYLTQETKVFCYLESGDVQEVYIRMNSKLDTIYAFEKNKKDENIVVDLMKIGVMDSCVRSSSAPAFKKKKSFFQFKRKPKEKNCFSILGVREMNKPQKTFNIECKDENSCIKYVDYLTNIINCYKNKIAVGE